MKKMILNENNMFNKAKLSQISDKTVNRTHDYSISKGNLKKKINHQKMYI